VTFSTSVNLTQQWTAGDVWNFEVESTLDEIRPVWRRTTMCRVELDVVNCVLSLLTLISTSLIGDVVHCSSLFDDNDWEANQQQEETGTRRLIRHYKHF